MSLLQRIKDRWNYGPKKIRIVSKKDQYIVEEYIHSYAIDGSLVAYWSQVNRHLPPYKTLEEAEFAARHRLQQIQASYKAKKTEVVREYRAEELV